MAPLKRVMRLGSLLYTAAAMGEAGLRDAEVAIQTAVGTSSAVGMQLATFRMLADAMGNRAMYKISSPHKHKDEHVGGDKEDKKKKKNVGLSSLAGIFGKPVEAKDDAAAHCTEEDFWAIDAHVKELARRFEPRMQAAVKNNDTQEIQDVLTEAVPTSCDTKQLVSMFGINWDKLEVCIVMATNVSAQCTRCPINFMQKVAGKTMLDIPSKCGPKCSAVASSAFKCGSESTECDGEVLESAAPCLGCLGPRFVELGKCAGVPHANVTEARLNRLQKAIGDKNIDAINLLVKEEADTGREELQALTSEGSPVLGKIMALSMSAVMD